MDQCQSCSLRLRPESFGTETTGAPSETYCISCYKKGSFTKDVSMDEMVQIASKQMLKELPFSKDEALRMAKEILPTLERWK